MTTSDDVIPLDVRLKMRAGTVRPDMTFEHQKTRRCLNINTVEMRPYGRGPTKREYFAAFRTAVAGGGRDVIAMVPKTPTDLLSTPSFEAFAMRLIAEMSQPADETSRRNPHTCVRLFLLPEDVAKD